MPNLARIHPLGGGLVRDMCCFVGHIVAGNGTTVGSVSDIPADGGGHAANREVKNETNYMRVSNWLGINGVYEKRRYFSGRKCRKTSGYACFHF